MLPETMVSFTLPTTSPFSILYPRRTLPLNSPPRMFPCSAPISCSTRSPSLIPRTISSREVSPSPATSLTVWELNYLIAKMKIKDVMVKNTVTIGPDATVEEAAALGQKHRIGALPVVDKGKLVGIITTTDLFRIMTEAFGFGRTYARLHLFDCPSGQPLDDALELIRKNGGKVKSVFSITVPGSGRPDTIVHLEGDEGKAAKIQEALNAKGCKLDLRWH